MDDNLYCYQQQFKFKPALSPIEKKNASDYINKINISIRKVNEQEMRSERHGFFTITKTSLEEGIVTVTFYVKTSYLYEYEEHLPHMGKYITDCIRLTDVW